MKNKNFKEFYNRQLIVEAEPTSITDTKTQNPNDVKNATSIGGMFKNAAKKAAGAALGAGKAVGKAALKQIGNELHPDLKKVYDKAGNIIAGTGKAIAGAAKDIKAIAARLKDINFPKKVYQAAFNKNVDELNNLLLEFPGNTKLAVDYKAQSNNQVFKQIPVFFPAIDGLVKAKANDTSVIEKFAIKYKDITALLSQSFKWKSNVKTAVPLEDARQTMGGTTSTIKTSSGLYDLDIVSFAIVLKAETPFIEALLKTAIKFKVDIKVITFTIIQIILLNENFELFNKLYVDKLLVFNNNSKNLIDTLVNIEKQKPSGIPAETLKIFDEIIKDYKPGAAEDLPTEIDFGILGIKIDLTKKPVDLSPFGYKSDDPNEQTIPRNIADALYYTLLCIKDPKNSAIENKATYLKEISKLSESELLNRYASIFKDLGYTGNKIKITGAVKENKQILDFEELGFEIDLNKPDFSKFNYDPAKTELQTIPMKLAKGLYYVLLCMQEPTWAKPENQDKKISEIKTFNANKLKVKLIYRLDKNQNPKCSSNIEIGK